MSRFVLGGSTTLSWCFEDESDASSLEVLERLVRDEALVPAIWPLEIANALLVGERRKRITSAKARTFLSHLAALPIVVEPVDLPRAFADVFALGKKHALSSYDAAYLELAVRASLPLATLDGGLRKAAKTAGVRLL